MLMNLVFFTVLYFLRNMSENRMRTLTMFTRDKLFVDEFKGNIKRFIQILNIISSANGSVLV